MTVRQLIEMLQTIQNKDKLVYYYDSIKQEIGFIEDISQGINEVYLTTIMRKTNEYSND